MAGQHGGGVGLDQVGQVGGGPLSGPADGVDVPPAGEAGGGPDHGHEGEALTLEVVEPVEEALARQRGAAVEETLGAHGGAEDEAAGPPQKGPVEVDEDGSADTLNAGHHGPHAIAASAATMPEKTGPDAAKGPAGGRPIPSLRLDRDGGGGVHSLGSGDHFAPWRTISQTANTDLWYLY